MKIEKPSNITDIRDFKKRKNNKKAKSSAQNASTSVGITDFKILSSYCSPTKSEPMDKEKVRAILDPDGVFSAKTKQKSTTDSSLLSSNLIDFEVLSSLFPNIKKSKETELVEFFIMEGYALSYNQAKKAIENYQEDAKLAKPVFGEIKKITDEFEQRIKGIDFSEFDKVKSIYEKKDKMEMMANFETPDSFIPSKKSARVTKNIARLYAQKLQESLPDYEIEVEDDKKADLTNNMTQISISKNNYIMQLYFNDFLSTVKNGKVHPNVQVFIEKPSIEKFDWHYDGVDGILNKVNKVFRGTIGAISKDSYDSKGEPEFYVDASFEAGPTYYGIVETMKTPEINSLKSDINDTGDMNEEEIKLVKDIILKSPEANKYYKQYGLIFVNSCLRNGNFNENVASAQVLLLELGQYFASDGEISLDYVKEIIDCIEEKDNYYHIDEDIFDVANNFIIKELNSGENHHQTVYNMINYVKKHPTEKVLDFADNLADELFNFEEVDSILEMLNNSSEKKQAVIIQKVNKLVRSFDESGALKPDIRIYDQLKHELHLK